MRGCVGVCVCVYVCVGVCVGGGGGCHCSCTVTAKKGVCVCVVECGYVVFLLYLAVHNTQQVTTDVCVCVCACLGVECGWVSLFMLILMANFL